MKKLITLVIFILAIIGFVFASRVGWIDAQFIWTISNEGKWLLPLIGISALIDSINPCAFSILILTIAFLFSIGQLRTRVIQIGGIYIFGIFLSYILIGLE